MNRAKQILFLLIVLIISLLLSTSATGADIAVTMDDFNLNQGPLLGPKAKNKAILKALDTHKIKATIFVTGKLIESSEKKEELKKWDKANHSIANHTYSHKNYHKTSFEVFSEEIKKCESLISSYDNFTKLFRFPMLKQGNTIEKRDQMRKFISEEGYHIGYVTIDTSDWYINNRLIAKLKQDPNTDLEPYREYYLNHLWKVAEYYDNIGKQVVGRDIKHTLLLHHNLLNALFLDDVLEMFKNKSWNLIDSSEAFSDEIFKELPDTMPAGESLIWALAKNSGNYESLLTYPSQSAEYEKAMMDELGL